MAMNTNPYSSLPESAYWRSAVAKTAASPDPSYCTPKWTISRTDRIATAGSCFAQHIGRRLRDAGYNLIDAEPAPTLLPPSRHADYGYGIYSARYGNIYTTRQLRQLAEEAFGSRPMSAEAWELKGRYVDVLRPTIEPSGHADPLMFAEHRKHHLQRVHKLLVDADIVVFTLGLTETWEDTDTGRILPICPGTYAGTYQPGRYRFVNLTFQEVIEDLLAFRSLLHAQRYDKPTRLLLTVSPVPLTATASGKHVMVATSQSKAVLRAAAGQLCDMHDDIDYFPSYEIVANPWSGTDRYASNLRSVLDSSVDLVMCTFMAVHGEAIRSIKPSIIEEPVRNVPEAMDEAMIVKCDEELLDAFGPPAR